MATSTTTDFGAALSAAIAGGYVAQLSGGTYTVTQPIVIHINSTIQGALGINGGGATIVSHITNGAPVIEIDVGPGVDLRYLNLSNFNIVGNGQEGDGIKIVADGNDRWAYNWNINNVNVSHVGGYGLDMQGSIFEGLVSNSFMNNNGLGGAYIGNSAGGGVASAMHWFGGGFENNNGAGLTLGDGMRDISVDGVTAANNHGPGIDAPSGITSVTNSTFQDNQGAGISYQVYGNFNDDSFTTSGAQTVGVSGYTVGETTLVHSTSTYTGAGADPTHLANFTGNGSLLETGNTGSVVTAAGVAAGGVGSGDHVNVSLSTLGVALPALAPVTAATTAAVASSDGTSPLETLLHAAFASGTVAQVTSATSYTVSAPIVIDITSSAQAVGIDLGGAKIESAIGNGAPVIEIVVGAGVDVGSLTLSNFSIFGNGAEGDGIKIVAEGADRSVQLNVVNVNVEHTGGIGLDVLGNVQGAVTDSWMNGNALGGARFANGPDGGVASGLQWVGGGFRLNGEAGLILQNGTHDMSVSGAYFVQNNGPGIDATSGITSVLASGFENNTGGGAVVQGSSNFTDDTFSTYGPQLTAVGGYLNGGHVTMTGIDAEYYGSGASDPIVLANLQGQGTLAIAGAGNVTAGSGITVTGGNPVVDAPNLGTAWGGSSSGSGSGPGGTAADGPAAGPVPVFTSGAIVNGEVTLTGTTSQANDQVTFYDGPNWLGATTTAGNGSFSFSAAAEATVVNTYGVYSTDPSGAIWHGASTLVIDPPGTGSTGGSTGGGSTPVLVFAGAVIANGAVTVTGSTGQANDQVTIYDGNSWLGATTTDSNGSFTFSASADASVANSYGGYATDPSGAIWHGTNTVVVNPPTPPTVTEALVQDTGASAADHVTADPAVTGTADPNAVVHVTVDGSAMTATATADASGAWSYTPVGLHDGQHTIVASETNATGLTGTATLSLVLDTTPPTVTETLASGGAPALTGTGDANATVHFAVDGSASAATATANASGAWSFTPTGLGTGQHTVVASETDLAGNTGTASDSFTMGPPTPTFTGDIVANGAVTLTGTTGQANDQVTIYDGNTWLGSATTGSNGSFTFAASANPAAANLYGAYATDPSGNIWHGTNNVIVGGTAAATLMGGTGNDIINGNGGNATVVGGAGADLLTGGSGQVTFAYQGVSDSAPSAPDTITDFHPGVDKIDFTNIAGITATGGVPQFQGNLTGTGNLTLNPHSVGYVEVGANTDILVNNTAAAETVTTSDLHAAQMVITLMGVHLGLGATDFHHA